MDKFAVLTLTRQGEAELRQGTTQLGVDDLTLLIHFDGRLTWQQVQAYLPERLRPGCEAALSRLLMRGLVEIAQPDAFAARMDADLQSLGLAAPHADACVASLQRSGFFVQIARRRELPPAAGVAQLNAILVEDDAALATFTESFLALCGLKVRVARNRAEVVQEMRRPPRPNLVLLDVVLPDVDGFAVLQRLREHPILHDVPVIMLTGKATRESVLRGMALGADGYITKPFDPETLMQAVSTVLGVPLGNVDRRDAWGNSDSLGRRP